MATDEPVTLPRETLIKFVDDPLALAILSRVALDPDVDMAAIFWDFRERASRVDLEAASFRLVLAGVMAVDGPTE